jgi:hypothetical protein
VLISGSTPLGVVLADLALLRHLPGTPGVTVGSTLHGGPNWAYGRGMPRQVGGGVVVALVARAAAPHRRGDQRDVSELEARPGHQAA